MRNRYREQRGFTLVESLVALAIIGLFGAAIAIAIFQVTNVNAIDNAHVVAVNQVENAIHYINRDVQIAQTVSPQGAQGFPLNLTWVSWDSNDSNLVTYNLSQNGNLVRQYSVNGGASTDKTVAQLISPSSTNTNCSYDPDNHKFTIKLTAIATSGAKQATETRQVEIVPRPGS